MSKPSINVIESMSGRTYRVTLCSMSNISRKKVYFIIEELRRNKKIITSHVSLSAKDERLAVLSFREFQESRETLETTRPLFPASELNKLEKKLWK